ncbi:MAG TPA: hypothetical protein VJ063_00510 [Verrucomicrobiae bacterium]|nr:hypothetical protein [Verrucomicrobiae bacterium]
MGLFKKKADPITERARTLNDQIASLEKEIARLADKLESETPEPPPAPLSPPSATPPKSARQVSAETQPGMPRLRSTAFPQSQVVVHSQGAEPVFEDVPNNPFKANGEEPEPEPEPDIGVRKGNVSELWKRLQNQFRSPPASNPKLVSYLAAGSIQGLRPLRYEKRVARNRAIALIVILVLVIWGLLAVFLRK